MPTKFGSAEPNRPKQSDLHATVECIVGGTPIETNRYLQSFSLTQKVHGSYECSFVFYDQQWDVLEDLLLRKGMGTPVDFRFGFRSKMSPWIRMVLNDYTPSFSNQGVTLTVPLTDAAQLANKKTRTKGYDVDEFPRISDIVRWICVENRWPFIIEPTSPHQNPITQDHKPDTHFIMHKLREQAVNETGIGGYQCYFEAGGKNSPEPTGRLHFHTVNFIMQTKGEVYKTYNFAKELDGDVIEFTPQDNTAVICMAGGKNADYECFDPRTKNRVKVERKLYDFKGRPIVGGGVVTEPTDDPGIVNRWVTRPFENPDELRRYAEARWAAFNQVTFSATLKVLGDPWLEPNTYVRVNVIKSDGQVHSRWSGRYLIKSVEHNIEAGSFTSTCELQRESAGELDNGTTTQTGGDVKLIGGKPVQTRDQTTDEQERANNTVRRPVERNNGN